MKKKKILFIILAIIVIIYLIINILYFIMGLNKSECCTCRDNPYLDVCCDCNYSVFEKLGRIIY